MGGGDTRREVQAVDKCTPPWMVVQTGGGLCTRDEVAGVKDCEERAMRVAQQALPGTSKAPCSERLDMSAATAALGNGRKTCAPFATTPSIGAAVRCQTDSTGMQAVPKSRRTGEATGNAAEKRHQIAVVGQTNTIYTRSWTGTSWTAKKRKLLQLNSRSRTPLWIGSTANVHESSRRGGENSAMVRETGEVGGLALSFSSSRLFEECFGFVASRSRAVDPGR
ncbi:hypothetical protein T440DRAFT_483061 [Plenodomus tracheiphilus IPT5]|uniref:Uncharacterized protein n=1 Tax=Plenodomus tracheiphilus IPT5 TaxID=1408161 RepID=A0A6A7AS49_9PLEO|nr:hypothetical protein T440DRAFT_483061 [Plenodomus tracheiphilus IPT5]